MQQRPCRNLVIANIRSTLYLHVVITISGGGGGARNTEDIN